MPVVTQANWLKGLNAATGKTTTVPGTLTRMSNMLYTKRGSLITCDGTKIYSKHPFWVSTFFEDVNEMIAAVTGVYGTMIPLGITAQFNPVGVALNLGFYDMSTNPATPIGVNGAAYTSSTPKLIQAFNAGGRVIVCPGNNYLASESPVAIDFSTIPANLYRISDGVSPDGTPAPVAAAHGVYHQGFIWLWNTAYQPFASDGPSVLRMCAQDATGDVDITNWPAANAIKVDADDGTQGQGMASFTSAEAGIAPTATLVLFKDFSTYQFTGLLNSAGGFTLSRAQTDMGCIAPRTIQFAPGVGIIRLTHFGVAVFDGVKDTLISEEIRPYIFQSEPDIQAVDLTHANIFSACITVNPPMYIMGAVLPSSAGINRIFCYDLVLKVWSIIDLPMTGFGNSTTNPMVLRRLATLKLPGQQPFTLMSDFQPPDFPSGDFGVRRWLSGDSNWGGTQTFTPISWNFRTPEVFGKNPASKVYFRRSALRAKSQSIAPLAGASNNLAISASFNFGGTMASSTVTKTPELVSGTSLYNRAVYGVGRYGSGSPDLVTPFDIGVTSFSANVTYSGSGQVEILANDWTVEPLPEGSFARFS